MSEVVWYIKLSVIFSYQALCWNQPALPFPESLNIHQGELESMVEIALVGMLNEKFTGDWKNISYSALVINTAWIYCSR